MSFMPGIGTKVRLLDGTVATVENVTPNGSDDRVRLDNGWSRRITAWDIEEVIGASMPLRVQDTKGIFEVRPYPITSPQDVQLRYGYADRALGDSWYVVINNGSRIKLENGNYTVDAFEWGYGLSWYHPDPNYQSARLGTFDQILTPVDDAARAIVKFVKEQDGV